jgi:hypothetical protein
LLTEHRQRENADAHGANSIRPHEFDQLAHSPSSFVVARANAMHGDGSRSLGDINIHGVEVESDFESDAAATPTSGGVNAAFAE